MIKTAKQREVLRCLNKLGFERNPGRSRELKFTYKHTNGVIITTVLVPKSQSDIKKGTLNKIRSQTRLDPEDFSQAIKCPFKRKNYEDYIEQAKLAKESPSKN